MKKFLVLVGVLLGSLSLSAGDRDYGCGLGYVIVGDDKPNILKITASYTNVVGMPFATFGITSGTSGCKRATSIFVFNEEAYEFTADNLDGLAKDISVGEGESLDTLATLLNQDDKEEFAKTLKDNFSLIFTSSDIEASEVLENIHKLIA